ncbi:hypothetical protein EV421DRAFT_1733424 [Armillaria borealis]|uniref:Uncharacterized protein n=1 Tax=Armillaria borealis TaxID=47425 RepID=A0AA39MVC6_9AGAR|nr:hypothetical protein EV421DRAFT_1733424 [Armillaria borealis]
MLGRGRSGAEGVVSVREIVVEEILTRVDALNYKSSQAGPRLSVCTVTYIDQNKERCAVGVEYAISKNGPCYRSRAQQEHYLDESREAGARLDYGTSDRAAWRRAYEEEKPTFFIESWVHEVARDHGITSMGGSNGQEYREDETIEVLRDGDLDCAVYQNWQGGTESALVLAKEWWGRQREELNTRGSGKILGWDRNLVRKTGRRSIRTLNVLRNPRKLGRDYTKKAEFQGKKSERHWQLVIDSALSWWYKGVPHRWIDESKDDSKESKEQPQHRAGTKCQDTPSVLLGDDHGGSFYVRTIR